MRRHLAREHRVLSAHALLDERVADAVHEGRTARTLDRLRHRPAGAHVVDHLLAGRLREDGLCQERRHEVAGDELAAVVDEEAPVGVTVVRDAQVGLLLGHLGDDELAVLGKQRIGLVIGEASVGLEVATDHVELRQALEDGREHHACHPVGGVDDDAERSNLGDVDERQNLRDEAGPDVLAANGSADSDRREPRLRQSADLREPRVSADGERPAPHDLHAGVLLRIVRCGDTDTAVELELGDGVIQHLRACETELNDVGPRVRDAVHDGLVHGRRGEPHVVADGDGL